LGANERFGLAVHRNGSTNGSADFLEIFKKPVFAKILKNYFALEFSPSDLFAFSSIHALMSSTRQAVVRVESFTGCGKRPSLTPAHHVDLPTGITFIISATLTKPVAGS